jgi:hypothetical protein
MWAKVPQTTAENTITPIQILFQQPQKLCLKNCYTCNSIQLIYYKINPLHSFFFVSFWIALQKTWYYQKIVKGPWIKLGANLSNKALINYHSVLWFMLHFKFVCMDWASAKLRSYQSSIKFKWYFQSCWTQIVAGK